MKLIACAVALLFLTTETAGDPLKADCRLSWVKYDNTQVKGLSQQTGIDTEEECKAACETNENCWNIDFNFEEKSCWFGDVHEPTARVPDSRVNHWDLLKDCTPAPPPTPPPTGVDCTEIYGKNPDAKSGVYSITVPGRTNPVQVYCDMDTSCGGWTVFQRRKDGSENFARLWDAYRNGFGDLNGEFWLGNDILSSLTTARRYRLRIDLGYWNGSQTFAEYNYFKVAGATDKYKLTYTVGSYWGNAAGNALGGDPHGGNFNHNGAKFSTTDQDNDNWSGDCAKLYKGGWWYNACHSCALNGGYNNTASSQGINWNDYTYSLKFTEMKIRSMD